MGSHWEGISLTCDPSGVADVSFREEQTGIYTLVLCVDVDNVTTPWLFDEITFLKDGATERVQSPTVPIRALIFPGGREEMDSDSWRWDVSNVVVHFRNPEVGGVILHSASTNLILCNGSGRVLHRRGSQ